MTIHFRQELNDEQYLAATYADGSLMILAGAGSGKTRTLIFRAAFLIQEKKIDPGQILLLTFTNKAAQEMQHRLQQLVNVNLPFAGTFHSFCAKFLRKEGYVVGIPPNFVIYDQLDQLELIKSISKELDIDPKQYRPFSLLNQISQAKQELLSPAQYKDLVQGSFQQVVAQVYTNYQARLLKAAALDFDDLLVITVNILENNDQVRTQYQQRFQHVLIDEYQDTNKAQYLIAKLLTKNHQQLTVVGDASQSIYRWRGADYRNLQYLEKDFPTIKTVKLERNYRSTQAILDAAYSVISNNRSHPILSLWTDSLQGELLTLHQSEDEKTEATYVIQTLKSIDPGETVSVLYRTNAQSRAFEEACIRAGISYDLVGGTKFYERKEIKDVLAYLRLLANPSDEVSYSRLEKLGKRKLQAFTQISKQINSSNTSVEIFDQILNQTKYLDKYDPQNEADLSRIENVKELRSVATQFDNINDFLENVALVENNRVLDPRIAPASTTHQLTLMTIHASKGLEFDHVFIAGLEEGIFPHSRSLLEQAELEEERRLCYVAITRAKKQVHLTHTHNRLYFGTYQNGTPSRFLSEIPSSLLKPSNPSFFQNTTQTSTRTYIPLDDDLLDRFLDDEVDIDQLLS